MHVHRHDDSHDMGARFITDGRLNVRSRSLSQGNTRTLLGTKMRTFQRVVSSQRAMSVADTAYLRKRITSSLRSFETRVERVEKQMESRALLGSDVCGVERHSGQWRIDPAACSAQFAHKEAQLGRALATDRPVKSRRSVK